MRYPRISTQFSFMSDKLVFFKVGMVISNTSHYVEYLCTDQMGPGKIGHTNRQHREGKKGQDLIATLPGTIVLPQELVKILPVGDSSDVGRHLWNQHV